MKALVTGGTGFIGSHLIARLRKEGFEVRCLAKDALNKTYLEALGVEVVLGDLNQEMPWDELLGDVDIIYHLAGVTRAKVMRDYFIANHEATRRFIKICVERCAHLKRFVYVSSQTVAGPRLSEQEITETTPCHPISHYGKSKRMAEMEVLAFRDALPITIVRPSAVYGPRDRDFLEYHKIIRSRIKPILGFGKKYLNLVHVDDLINGIFLASMSSAAVGEIFFIGSERNYQMREVCDAIARAHDVHPFGVVIPKSMLYAIGAIAGFIGKVTNRQTLFNLQKAREASQKAWTCSVEKAMRLLGYNETIPLADGIAQTYAWYRENGWM